jgi:hypothetical protein
MIVGIPSISRCKTATNEGLEPEQPGTWSDDEQIAHHCGLVDKLGSMPEPLHKEVVRDSYRACDRFGIGLVDSASDVWWGYVVTLIAIHPTGFTEVSTYVSLLLVDAKSEEVQCLLKCRFPFNGDNDVVPEDSDLPSQFVIAGVRVEKFPNP